MTMPTETKYVTIVSDVLARINRLLVRNARAQENAVVTQPDLLDKARALVYEDQIWTETTE